MSIIQKPTTKTITNAGITAVSFVAGAKIGDGIAAVMPESTAPYKKIALGVAGILLAASVNAKTPASQAAQSALLGMGAKQILDEVTDQLTTAVAKQATVGADGVATTSTVQKFINGAVGHLNPSGLGSAYLSAAWDTPVAESVWDRPLLAEPIEFDPASMV